MQKRWATGGAYSNLGIAYKSQGDYAKAIEYHTQDLEIAKEVGDRAGDGMANGNLGTCHMHLNDCKRVLTSKPFPTTKYNMLCVRVRAENAKKNNFYSEGGRNAPESAFGISPSIP